MLESDPPRGTPFERHVNPALGELLRHLRMDKTFVHGDGTVLRDALGRTYLDFIGAYGALPFGHNPTSIWAALYEVAASGEPNFVQPSALGAASELARELFKVAPDGLKYVAFANSGAEAVEAAIKLCRAATGRMGVLTTDNSFHGKTLGALSATGNASHQAGFGAPVAGFDTVPFGDLAALDEALESAPTTFAVFLVEPIQSEGGVIEAPERYLAEAQRRCREKGVLFAVDEIQTGLGRTGTLFACTHEDIAPDVLILAKALGGGLMPIGACLFGPKAYSEHFALKHSSTFAGNTLAARAGLAALRLLTADDQALVRRVAENGARLKAGLEQLQVELPQIIRQVRGRGYLLGLHLQVDRTQWPNRLLGHAVERGALGVIAASYLLNVEGIRVAPTLNGNDVLRIEPPLTCQWSECEALIDGLRRALRVLATGDTGRVLQSIMRGVEAPRMLTVTEPNRASSSQAVLQPNDGRFAFLVHPLTQRSFVDFDPTMATLSDEELSCAEAMLGARGSAPLVVSSVRIQSKTGACAWGEFIVVPRTADALLMLSPTQAVAEVGEAVKLAKRRGAHIVGLGAYTSVVTRGGLALRNAGVPLTTGNSYTVVATQQALEQAVRHWRGDDAPVPTAIVGATGAIGRALAILLSETVSKLILIGRPGKPAGEPHRAFRRLEQVAAEACRHVAYAQRAGQAFAPRSFASRLGRTFDVPSADAPLEAFGPLVKQLRHEGLLVLADNVSAAISTADAVVTATSSTAPLIDSQLLRSGAVVCDVSRPRNVGVEIRSTRPDVLVLDGGVIEVPGSPELMGLGLGRGLVFACMAETMMLALEGETRDTSLGGRLELETILRFRTLATTHGFQLASLRSFDSMLSWQSLVEARPPHLIDQRGTEGARWT